MQPDKKEDAFYNTAVQHSFFDHLMGLLIVFFNAPYEIVFFREEFPGQVPVFACVNYAVNHCRPYTKSCGVAGIYCPALTISYCEFSYVTLLRFTRPSYFLAAERAPRPNFYSNWFHFASSWSRALINWGSTWYPISFALSAWTLAV